MPINLPESDRKRIVIVGAGFGGLTLARKLARSNYQVVLLDKHNYHQFQPLFYQVAMAGLEPSSISFPLRRIFRQDKFMHIRLAEVLSVDTGKKQLTTDVGIVNYDVLVLATGVTTNYYGNTKLAEQVYTLKSVSDALYLRNAILSDFESALMERDYQERQGRLDIAVVGGGPTGVELAGALAEMRKFILPREYQEIDAGEMDIYLIEGSPAILNGMSDEASEAAEKFLTKLGVQIRKNARVTDFDGENLSFADGTGIKIKKVIWAAGITGVKLAGLPDGA
jgi:NADH dehydrogenase